MPDPLALHGSFHQPDLAGGLTHVLSERRLARLLAFAGRSIDDVVNCGVSKRLVAGYFKLDRKVARRVEVLDWRPNGTRWVGDAEPPQRCKPGING